MSDELTPEQVAQIGATGCATAWADHIWTQMQAVDGNFRANLRDILAPLLVGLAADHRRQIDLMHVTEGDLL
jgi:hypothetical protein